MLDLTRYKDNPKFDKWANQRLTRGFSDIDRYDADYYLASLISTLLRDMAQHNTSYPQSMGSMEMWQAWLMKTADMFDSAMEDYFDTDLTEPIASFYDRRRNDLKECFARLAEHWFDLWD